MFFSTLWVWNWALKVKNDRKDLTELLATKKVSLDIWRTAMWIAPEKKNQKEKRKWLWKLLAEWEMQG